VLFCMMLGSSAMGMVSPTIPFFLKAAASSQEILRVLGKESHQLKISSNAGLVEEGGKITGHLTLKEVTFCYPERPTTTVLDRLSLDIPENKTTAVVGYSGSGKSTIVGLLERWYSPSEGTIFLDSRDIQQLDISTLRDQIGLVQQVSF
jgi:ATP-binding cassette subfamily B (MDR/TAP) protein 1